MRLVGGMLTLASACWAIADPTLAAPVAKLTSPEWLHDSRWYEVDVGWFRNGEPANDPRGTQPWGTPPTVHARGTTAQASYSPMHGADLQGLRKQLTYLKRLGVNTLYLSSVLRELGNQPAPGVHVQDWLAIADSLKEIGVESADPGTWQFTQSDKYFLAFVHDAHQAGLRVVLDDPFGRLDLARETNPHAKAHLSSLVKRWMDPNGDGNPADGVDGWATIAPATGSLDLYRWWRAQIKSINHDGVLLGIAPSREDPFRAEGAFDALVNYGAARAILRFVTRDRNDYASDLFLRDLGIIADRHPDTVSLSVAYAERNERFLDRLMKSLGGTSAGTSPSPNVAALWRMQAVLQHTLAGPPLTLYGDEVGLRLDAVEGTEGVRNIPLMPWDDLSNPESKTSMPFRDDFQTLVRWLHALRDDQPALRRGTLRGVLTDHPGGVVAFARTLADSEVIVAVNTSHEPRQVMLPCAEPGQPVVLLTPPGSDSDFKPAADSTAEPARPEGSKPPASGAVRKDVQIAGTRQNADANGSMTLSLEPYTVRLIVRNAAAAKQ